MRVVLLSLVCILFAVSFAATAGAQSSGACESSATAAPGLLLVCPAGDGATLASIGSTIYVTVRDADGNPIANVPFGDLWLDDCFVFETPTFLPCVPIQTSSNADANSDANGSMTVSGTIKGGGCSDHLMVVIQGAPLQDPNFPCDWLNFTNPLCLPIATRSPDINGDHVVDLIDVSLFASHFGTSYSGCEDLNGDGVVSLQDLALFAQHIGHTC